MDTGMIIMVVSLIPTLAFTALCVLAVRRIFNR